MILLSAAERLKQLIAEAVDDVYENVSLLDTDFYKLTMLQYIWKYYSKVRARFGFNNRHWQKVPLGKYISAEELQHQFDHLRTLRFTEGELEYLANLTSKSGRKYFCPEFIEFLRTDFRFPEIHVQVVGDQLKISVDDLWMYSSYAETFILNTVSALYTKAKLKELGVSEETAFAEGVRRLEKKIEKLKEYYSARVSHFGTRRRANRRWDEYVHYRLTEVFGGQARFLGTSNVFMAMKLHIPVVGTFAHELMMTIAALNSQTRQSLRASPKIVLRQWEELYGPDLLTALSDTFGTESFFEDFAEFAKRWGSVRHDSGDPFEFGERAIRFFIEQGMDPMKEAAIVFSDGLTVDMIAKLFDAFKDRIWMVFGWGTDLSNDLGFFAPISMVVKVMAVAADMFSKLICTVKLSDNPNKAMSEDPELIPWYKDVFCYREHAPVAVVY